MPHRSPTAAEQPKGVGDDQQRCAERRLAAPQGRILCAQPPDHIGTQCLVDRFGIDARLVVDTGIHALKWSREQAIQSLIDQTGRAPGAAQSEIDRYISTPGQACGYKVGHTEILRLRAHAQQALGPRFDLRDFNDAVVTTGGVPLTVLATAVDAYVAGAR